MPYDKVNDSHILSLIEDKVLELADAKKAFTISELHRMSTGKSQSTLIKLRLNKPQKYDNIINKQIIINDKKVEIRKYNKDNNQCRNCHRLGHKANNCNHPRTCVCCSQIPGGA